MTVRLASPPRGIVGHYGVARAALDDHERGDGVQFAQQCPGFVGVGVAVLLPHRKVAEFLAVDEHRAAGGDVRRIVCVLPRKVLDCFGGLIDGDPFGHGEDAHAVALHVNQLAAGRLPLVHGEGRGTDGVQAGGKLA